MKCLVLSIWTRHAPRIDESTDAARIAMAQSIFSCYLAAAGPEYARNLATIAAPENMSPITPWPKRKIMRGPARPNEKIPFPAIIPLQWSYKKSTCRVRPKKGPIIDGGSPAMPAA